MPAETRLAEFITKANAAGLPQESLVGILKAHGWPEREIYDALGLHVGGLLGIEVPRRAGVRASARDAFFYLLLFATLATWTIGFGSLAFALIDRWLADPLFSRAQLLSDGYSIASAIATLLVAFPLFLLVSRIVARDLATHPDKLDSPIRKWLTYMALVIAACVFMGDLITALTYLLRGELTSRFLARSLVVLALSGGVFSFYFDGLRRGDLGPASSGRGRLMAAVSSLSVTLLLLLGLWQLGLPGSQRQLRADEQRLQQLYQLSHAVREYWTSHQSQLPPDLNAIAGPVLIDPLTGAPYEYHPKQASHYQLCATFARPSDSRRSYTDANAWTHPAGHHCFSLDASNLTTMPQPVALGPDV